MNSIFSEHVASDILHGCVVVLCTLCAFIGLVWLREQILHGGGPDWLEQDVQNEVHHLSKLLNKGHIVTFALVA